MPSGPTKHLLSTLPMLGVLSIGASAHLAQAQPMGEAHLNINATTDFSDLHAGESGLLAIDIVVEDGWHTYWPGVSDTGFGISFNVDAPDTVELKDPIWPSPQRYLLPGDILDHTYEGTQTVLFPFVIKDGTPESVVVFHIESNFLVCKDICLPGKAATTATVRVVDTTSERVQTARYDELRAALRNQPKPFDAKDMAVRLQWITNAAAVMFRDATRIEFYPDTECTALEYPIKDGAAEGNRLEIRFTESENPRSEPKVLSGRLRVTTRTGVEQYDIDETAP